MTRWSITLSAYKIKIKHIAGNKNTAADALSRKFIEDKDENEPKQAISDEFIDKSTFPAEELSNELTLEQKQNILRQHHDSPTAEHPGIKETLRKVSKQHSWPGLKQFVTNYVKGCENCQRYKINQHPLKLSLQGISALPSNRPFAQIAMDLITDLPKSKGFDSILSVVDHGLTKGIILIPTTKGVTLEGIAILLIDNLFQRFGIPDKVISDHDPQFVAKSMKAFFQGLGIKQATSTAFHPQTDGTTEQFNQEIGLYLAIYCADNPEIWADKLPMAEYSHNSRLHRGRSHTPFKLMFEHPTKTHIDIPETSSITANNMINHIENIRTNAKQAHEVAQNLINQRIKSKLPDLKAGTQVWLDSRHIQIEGTPKKLAPKHVDLFEILERTGSVNYRLKLLPHWKMHPIFHIHLLWPTQENTQYGRFSQRSPPKIIAGEEEWKVEDIIDSRNKNGVKEFLIYWKGYPETERTWKLETNITNAKQLLKTYKRRQR